MAHATPPVIGTAKSLNGAFVAETRRIASDVVNQADGDTNAGIRSAVSRARSLLLAPERRWRDGTCMTSHKMLRKLQRLTLVIALEVGAVENFGRFTEALVDEAADDLAVFKDERHLVRAHLEHDA